VNAESAGPARVVRWSGSQWAPVGPVLPPVADDLMHDDHAHLRRVSYWHLPAGIAAAGDRLLCRERAWEFLGRCGRWHRAVLTLADAYGVLPDELLNNRDVWSMRPVRTAAQ
jgi:hypothetical protein